MTLPNCRLFLVAPGSGDADQLAQCLSAALAAGDVASLLITELSEAGGMRQVAEQLLPLAQSGDAAVLIESDCELARKLGADGVEVMADADTCKTTRKRLGSDMAIGADCRGDRHAAMEMAEVGADYVRLSPFARGPGDESLIAWWSQLFEIPCVTSEPLTTDQIADAVKLGADFVQPDDTMWTSPQIATEVIGRAMQAIAAARQ